MAITLTPNQITEKIETFLAGIEPLLNELVPLNEQQDMVPINADNQATMMQAVACNPMEHDNLSEMNEVYPYTPSQLLTAIERLAESDMEQFLFQHSNDTGDMWESDIRCILRSLLYAYCLRATGVKAGPLPNA